MDQRSYEMSIEALHTIVTNASMKLGGRALSQEQFDTITAPYDSPTRFYHTVGHQKQMSFMAEGEIAKFGSDIRNPVKAREISPLVTLAGFYHDAVYTQVDKGTTPAIEKVLSKYVTKDAQGVYKLRTDLPRENQTILDMVGKVFGVNAGAELPAPAKQPLQNEFLSALLAADQMGNLGHTPASIVQVAAIIEGTVPFLPKDRFQTLATRLEQVNKEHELKINPADLSATVKASVFEANKDVLAFAGNDMEKASDRLLEVVRGSWKLIPEANARYSAAGEAYTAVDYRKSMQGNLFFLTRILGTPEKPVFHEYDGYPLAADLVRLQQYEKEVRETTQYYFEAKTVSAAIVEALLAERNLENTPMRNHMRYSKNYLGFVSTADTAAAREKMPESMRAAYEALESGRNDNPSFDITRAPIAAFIMQNTGKEGIDKLLQQIGVNLKGDTPDYAAFREAAKGILGRGYGTIANALVESEKQRAETANIVRDRG